MKNNTVKVIIALVLLLFLSLPGIYGFLINNDNKTNVFSFAPIYSVEFIHRYYDETDSYISMPPSRTEEHFMGYVVNLNNEIQTLDTYNVEVIINGAPYNSSTYTVNESSDIVINYYLNRYTIDYELNGGLAGFNPTVYTEKTGTVTINNPTRAGYTFTGWTWPGQTTPVLDASFSSTDKENKSFTANWTAQGYNLTTGQTINPLILSTVQHVVFGKTSDYTNEIQGLTATSVGATQNDLIYFYHNTSTKTVYILSDGVIKFNPASNYMFSNKNNIQDITFANIDTSAATSMADMFSKCTGLTTLDLSLFDTHNVTNMSSMFGSDRNLTTIYASDLWSTAAVTTSTGMFQSCSKLVGGNGTRYNNGHQDATYARIDEGSTHGYFTRK